MVPGKEWVRGDRLRGKGGPLKGGGSRLVSLPFHFFVPMQKIKK